MKINKLKRLKDGKYQIVFENGDKLITYDEVILKYNLLYKKELDSYLLAKIEDSNEYYKLYNESVKYLTWKVRSYKEYNNYLDKENITGITKELLINDMKRLKLLDDISFVKAYISDRFFLTSDGPLKIKESLLGHDIEVTLIDSELAKISEEDIILKLRKLIDKKLKITNGSNFMIKQKISYEMNVLGYDKQLIDDCLLDNIDDSLSLKKEFDKYYYYYVKKGHDINKVFLKVKSKLYQKGYTISDIDNLINEKRNSL